jgi:ubiquinone/menaquinone biosynthesis C-methylase UbiE
MILPMQCPRCGNNLDLKDESFSCYCGYSLKLQDGVYELKPEDAQETPGYDDEYYDSRFYDYSEDRIFRVIWLANIRPGSNVLDLGCGPGAISVRCALQGAQVFGADPSRAALRLSAKRARKAGVRLNLFEFDGQCLPFRSSSFETVILADVAEHINDATLTYLLEECFRLMVPGGRLVLHTAPSLEAIRFCGLLHSISLGAFDPSADLITPEYEHLHIRYHSQDSIKSMLKKCGLSPLVWGEVRYLRDRLPRRLHRALNWLLADQIWALAFKGHRPAVTFQAAPYLDAIDIPPDLDMGSCVEWALGSGFYDAEEGSFRWTEKEAVLYLRPKEGCSQITMEISAPRPDIEREPVKLTVYIDGKEAACFILDDGCRRTFTLDLPGMLQPGLHKLRLAVDRSFTPIDWGINQDSRKLGIVIYSIGVK